MKYGVAWKPPLQGPGCLGHLVLGWSMIHTLYLFTDFLIFVYYLIFWTNTWIWGIFKIFARTVFEVIEFWDFDLHFFSLTKKTALNLWLLISLGCVPATKHQINKQCTPLECPIQVPCLIHLWSRFKTLQSTTVQSTCWASFARSGRYFHSSAYVCVNQGRRNWWPQG